jgi:hypothetical protein
MDAEGNVLATHNGPRTVEGFEQTGKKALAFLDLKKKAEKGDKAAKTELLIAQAELGHLPPDEIQKRMGEVTLTAEQKTRLEGILATTEVRAILGTVGRDPASQREAGKKFWEMRKAGKPAPAGEQESFAYWLLIMAHAEGVKDAVPFEEALNALKAKLGANPQAKKVLEEREAALKKLKEGAAGGK